MIRYALVDYPKFKMECELLQQMHYLEVVAPRGQAYNMHDEAYEAYGENVRIIVGYDETETPVGYHVAVVTDNPHDADSYVAFTDLLFLHPDQRKGRNGMDLMRVAKADLTAFAPGALWRAAVPIDGPRDMGVLLERGLGMTPVERVYELRLEDTE